MAMKRNEVTVDTLSTALSARDAANSAQGDGDQDRHGLSDDEQHQRAGQSFLNEVTHGWLTVDAELHAEVAGDERRPPLYVTHGERVIEVVLGLRCLDELEVFRQSAGRSWPQNVEERIAQQIHGAKCQRTDG